MRLDEARSLANAEPIAVERVRVPRGSFKPHRNASPVPAALRAVPLEIRFPQDASLRDLVAAITASAPNVQIAFRFTREKSEDILKRKIPFVRYDGNLGNLLDSLRTAMGVVVFAENGLIYISDREQYSVTVPQNEEMLESLAKDLKDLGADDIVSSVRGGRIVYTASAAAQRDVIAPYLDRYSRNMALVTIQTALVSVSINDESATGFDWNKLKVAFDGRNSVLSKLANGNTTTGTGTVTTGNGTTTGTNLGTAAGGALGTAVGTGTSTAASTIGLSTVDPGRVMDLTKDGLVVSTTSLGRLGGAFGATSITGAIDFLSTFGSTKVDQNVQMKTLSGTEVKLRSGQQVPYVRGVQLAGYGGGYGGNSGGYGGGYGGGLGSSLTDKVETGLTMEVTPYYDSDAEVVTMEVDVKLKEILSFVELNAGNQIGTFTQPLTQDQQLTDIVRIQAGRTVVIGGLQSDSETFSGVEPTALRNATATRAGGSGVFGQRSQKVKRNALFIILRPAVTVFVPEDSAPSARK